MKNPHHDHGVAADAMARTAPPATAQPAQALAAPSRWGWRSGRRRAAMAAAALLALVAALAFAAHQQVLAAAAPFVRAVADAPAADAIVVLGARIHADGRPYSLLVDRLVTAEDLWRHGKAPRIVLSGRGGGGVGDDEVAAMRRYLAGRGVPDAAMVDDPLGLRTIDTMRRCRDVYGVARALVVTNPFHVPRAVFLARSVGLEAHGVEAPYGHDYGTATMLRNRAREVAARVWAWCEVAVAGR
ncbi:MAG: vancomycin high temperature exclusion protein [Planctomycetota bacterium]